MQKSTIYLGTIHNMVKDRVQVIYTSYRIDETWTLFHTRTQ